MTIADLIPILAGILALLVGGGVIRRLSLGRTKQEPAPPKRPPDPKHSAEEHGTAIVLDGADAIDAAAADHDAEPNTVSELVELADKER